MPSRKHQSLVKLLAKHPRLLVELVRQWFGFQVPGRVELLRGPEVVRVLGSERIADGVLVIRRHGKVQETMVVEVQLRLVKGKRKAWALYVVGTWAELGAPTTLVVLTPSERVARWASEAIDLGRGKMVLQPLVLGPQQIPAEMSLAQARARPDALALSVLIHGHKRGSIGLVRTAMKVARELIASGDEERRVLGDLIVGAMGKDVRKIVEAEMIVDGEEWFSDVVGNYMKGRSEGRTEGLQEGRTEGLQEGSTAALGDALRMVLETRGLRPSAAQRARIERCRNRQLLETWLRRAVLAKDVAEILRSERATSRGTRLGRRAYPPG
jgi:hypothetical protein